MINLHTALYFFFQFKIHNEYRSIQMSETLLTKKDLLLWSECNIQIEAGNMKSFEATESAKLRWEKAKKQKTALKNINLRKKPVFKA